MRTNPSYRVVVRGGRFSSFTAMALALLALSACGDQASKTFGPDMGDRAEVVDLTVARTHGDVGPTEIPLLVGMDEVTTLAGGPNAPLNCTANDVRLFATVLTGETPVCFKNALIPQLDIAADVVSGANARWDIGFYIARARAVGDPTSARTGPTNFYWLEAPLSTDVGTPGDFRGPNTQIGANGVDFYTDPMETAGDVCGDTEQGVTSRAGPISLINTVCQDTDQPGDAGFGFLDIGSCVSWDNNNNNPACTDSQAIDGTTGLPQVVLETGVPNTTAKCTCEPLNIPVTVLESAKIEVVKETDPDGFGGDDWNLFVDEGEGVGPPTGDDLLFEVTSGPVGDGGTTGAGGTMVYAGTITDPGATHSIEEQFVNGSLDDFNVTYECVDRGTTDVRASGSGPGPFDLVLNPDDDVVCTFTNAVKRGTVNIKKITDPEGGTGFAFTDDIEGPGFSLDHDQTKTFTDVLPGGYQVAETDPSVTPGNFMLSALVCVDPDDGTTTNLAERTATIDVDPGETVNCTFTNTEGGMIVIDKVTDPSGDPTPFDFSGACGDFTLTDEADPQTCAVAAGTYAVAEAPEDGWELTSATCDDDGGGPDDISVIAGATVTCTFTNTQRTELIVKKVAVGGDATFSYTSTTVPGAPFDLTTSGGTAQMSFMDLPAGTYDVAEADAGPMWDLTSATCDDDGGPPSDVTLAAGATVTCTFTNTKRGKVIVRKTTVPAGLTDDFTFSQDIDASGNFMLSDGGMTTFDNVMPGAYDVAETVPAEFDLTDVSCIDPTGGSGSGGADNAQIDVAPGETVECTFTNSKLARLVVTKSVVGGGAQLFDFSRTGIANFTLGHLGSNDSGVSLEPGMYEVCELTLAVSWSAAATVNGAPTPLDNPDMPEDLGNRCVTVDLNYGDDVTVAWENSPPPGGNARTIGYWKNWSSCSNGQQYNKAMERGILDKTLDGNLPQMIGDVVLDNCEDARNILDKRDLGGKKKANDAAYGLAAQLLAAKLNFSAGAGTCVAATTAANSAQILLADIDFVGTGNYLRRGAVYENARVLAATLDAYNNNTLCSP
ncbi:MAG: prealbumin-like fold domain-containing protein [Longimicrobiales bacterium]